jgi:uncharacterized protein
MRRRFIVLLAFVVPALHAQGALVHVTNGDTVRIEKFARTATRLDVEMLDKSGARQTFSNAIESDGRLGTLTLAAYSPNARADAAPMARATISFAADTAVAIIQQGSQAPQTQRIPSKMLAQPVMNTSFSMFEVLLALARRANLPTAAVTLFAGQGGATFDVKFDQLQSDSVTASVNGAALWLVTDSGGRLIRGGIPSQKLVVTRVDAITLSKLTLAKANYSAPAGAPYSAEDVTVPTSLGHTLGGTFTKPTTATGRLPVIISITGSGPQDRDEYIDVIPKGYRLFRQIADTASRRGIAMLRMDDRGYGQSTGSFAAATSRDFANDIRAAIAYVITRADVDPRKIFLVGHSEGGLIAPMVAVDEPTLAGIVLMAGPGRSGRAILEYQMGFAVKNGPDTTVVGRAIKLAKVPASVDSLLRSTPWLTFFGAHDPIATARRVRTPVLILQGADDQQVIAAEAPLLEKAFRAARNRDVTMHVFPELNHFFIRQPGGSPAGYATLSTNLADSNVLGILTDWIATRAATRRR